MKQKSTIKQIAYILVFAVLSLTVVSSLCKKNKAPEKPTTPTGTTSTYNNAPETYTSSATDPDNNNVRLVFDWGDTNIDSAFEYVASGTSVSMDHAWSSTGTYTVKVKAIDEKGLESEWSDTLSVSVAYNSPPTIDSITGPGLSPYLMAASSTRYIVFTTVARDSTDSVYVRFMSKKKSAASYTLRSWIGPKVSSSIFRDSMTFASQDTYLVRAIAKDARKSQSETTGVYTVIVSGPAWTFNTPDGYEFYSSPALVQVDGEWLICIGGYDGYFYIVSATSGSQRWAKKTLYDPYSIPPEPEDVLYASPAVNAYFTPPHAYIGGEMGELYCYKVGSGTSWEWRFPDSSYDNVTGNEISNSAAFKDNRIYVGVNCGYANDYRMYCLQDNGSSSATEVWSYPTGCEIVSSPAIDGSGNIYFGDDSGYVTRLTSSGTKTWRIRIGTGVYSVYASVAMASDGIYVGTDDGFLYKLNTATGATIWKYPSSGSGLDGVRSSPVIGTDGAIYFGCDDGKLYAVSASGQLKSGFPVTLSDDVITSTPAIAQDGSIIMYTDEDLVYSINPSGAIMWRVPLPGYSKSKIHHTPKLTKHHSKMEDILPSPTIGSNGTIYVGSVQQGMYAITGTTSNALANTSWPKFRHDLVNSGKYTP